MKSNDLATFTEQPWSESQSAINPAMQIEWIISKGEQHGFVIPASRQGAPGVTSRRNRQASTSTRRKETGPSTHHHRPCPLRRSLGGHRSVRLHCGRGQRHRACQVLQLRPTSCSLQLVQYRARRARRHLTDRITDGEGSPTRRDCPVEMGLGLLPASGAVLGSARSSEPRVSAQA